MSVDDLLAALAAGEFAAIEGTAEDGSIDFKSQPYRLADELGKYELAKDVASFASPFPDVRLLHPAGSPPQRATDLANEIIRPPGRGTFPQELKALAPAGHPVAIL